MRRFRFHLGTLVILVLILGIGFAALRESTETWDSITFGITLGTLVLSILLAIHRTESRRAFWLGFALFGWAYLVPSLIPLIQSRLITTKALAFIDSKLPRSVSGGFEYFDYDNDGRMDLYVVNNSQPNALYVNKGNGTFQDVTTTVGLNSRSNGTLLLNNSGLLVSGSTGTTENFMRIGHSLCALIAAMIGGHLSRHLHETNRQTVL
jgi:hypothetical protein